MIERTAVPKVLRFVAVLLVLRLVLGKHHHGGHGGRLERMHRQWHERMGSIPAEEKPGGPESPGGETGKGV